MDQTNDALRTIAKAAGNMRNVDDIRALQALLLEIAQVAERAADAHIAGSESDGDLAQAIDRLADRGTAS